MARDCFRQIDYMPMRLRLIENVLQYDSPPTSEIAGFSSNIAFRVLKRNDLITLEEISSNLRSEIQKGIKDAIITGDVDEDAIGKKKIIYRVAILQAPDI